MQIFRRYLSFAGIGIQNARLFDSVKTEQQQNQVLLGLAQSIFEEQTSLQKLIQTMMAHARFYLQCQRIALYVFSPSEASVSLFFFFFFSSSAEKSINSFRKP